MDDEQTPESEQLYARGMAQLRAAQWKAAVETLSELRTLSNAYPELDTLISDALLKIEIERLGAPDGLAPPKPPGMLRPRFLTAALGLFLLGGALLIVWRVFGVEPAPVPPPPTVIAALPTPAPTDVPTATAEPSPTAVPTVAPTAVPTATPVAAPEAGALLVRMA